MKTITFTVSVDHHNYNFMFFDGFLEWVVEQELLEQEYIEAGYLILKEAQERLKEKQC